MCGIAGIFDLKGTREVDRAALQRMNDAMINRGPDGEGFFHAPGIGFAHRRLAIIDIEGGQQPFTTQDKRSVLTFNGEIYNYQDLSEALTDEVGMTLRTKSDTEALAELWNIKGAPCLEDLLGMFAFGLWNKEDKTLTLARDRLGERPLYYAQSPDGWLLFASDINAIMASGMIEAKMRADAVADYFALGYVPDPKAIYENVFKLPPAHTLTICQGLGSIPEPEAYWSVHFRPDEQMSEAESLSKLTELLDKAVSSQMISDVPLGAFLSGGVDSSAIVASMSHAHQGKVKTCSIGFKEASHDEREFAQMIADRYETDHREKVISLEAHSLIDTIAKAYGEPFADSSALPSYLVCQMARETVTVALSGDGGDELFAGYRRYPMFRREEQMKKALQGPKGNIKAATQIFGKIGDVFPKLDWAPRPFRLKTTLQSIGDTTANAYLRAVSTSLPDRLEKMTSASFHADLDGYHVAD
ncbi:MAG: asparagine synthase (glutamine-hydrolyzing), partial [Parvularculaceae bacterium]